MWPTLKVSPNPSHLLPSNNWCPFNPEGPTLWLRVGEKKDDRNTYISIKKIIIKKKNFQEKGWGWDSWKKRYFSQLPQARISRQKKKKGWKKIIKHLKNIWDFFYTFFSPLPSADIFFSAFILFYFSFAYTGDDT